MEEEFWPFLVMIHFSKTQSSFEEPIRFLQWCTWLADGIQNSTMQQHILYFFVGLPFFNFYRSFIFALPQKKASIPVWHDVPLNYYGLYLNAHHIFLQIQDSGR